MKKAVGRESHRFFTNLNTPLSLEERICNYSYYILCLPKFPLRNLGVYLRMLNKELVD